MTQDITNLINDAKNGNPKAQYNLGVCYHSGRDGLKQDYEQAAMWYQKAAEQGHVRASFIWVCYIRTEKVQNRIIRKQQSYL